MTTPLNNRRWRLVRRPEGDIAAGDLEFTTAPVPALAAGEVLVRNVYLSLDPTHRIWMSDRDQYLPPVEIGAVMRGGGIGVVEDTRSERFARGDIVSVGLGGWEDYTVASERQLGRVRRLDGVPLTAHLSVLGSTGLTAWYGLMDICQPKAGETVVVSAASGAVGAVVGQLAKQKGCRVVGVAGGAEKCAAVVNEFGFDACVDYKAGNLAGDLKAATPGGIDGCFENVGGAVLDTVLSRMNAFGRIAVCGLISGYNGEPMPIENFRSVLINRLKIQGFIVSEHMELWPQALSELAAQVASGQLRYRETVAQGIESAPEAFIGLLKGRNFGKQLVKLI